MNRVAVDGRDLEVRWFSPPVAERPTIVLLHEALGSVDHWKRFPSRLAERCRCGVVAYSRVGYGRSQTLDGPRERGYLEHEAQIVLPGFLKTLEIERPVLFGHSDGASIALIYAGAFPDAPAGIVLEAPHVNVEQRSVTGIQRLKQAFENGDLHAKLSAYHDDPNAAFYGWSDVWLDPAFADWNIERFVEKIRCPVLAIQGTRDGYGTVAQIDAIARRTRDCEVLLLEGGGHSPHIDHLESVLEATSTFVSALRSRE